MLFKTILTNTSTLYKLERINELNRLLKIFKLIILSAESQLQQSVKSEVKLFGLFPYTQNLTAWLSHTIC